MDETDSQFKSFHYQLLDLIDESDTESCKEQEVLDQHDDNVYIIVSQIEISLVHVQPHPSNTFPPRHQAMQMARSWEGSLTQYSNIWRPWDGTKHVILYLNAWTQTRHWNHVWMAEAQSGQTDIPSHRDCIDLQAQWRSLRLLLQLLPLWTPITNAHCVQVRNIRCMFVQSLSVCLVEKWRLF